MTTTKQRVLEHLIDVATGRKWNIPPQKRTAWDMAKNYAQIDPYQMADMPELLKQAMHARNAVEKCG